MSILLSWLILTLAVWFTAVILPGFHVKSFKGAIGVAALFGLLNFFLGWILFALLTIATLGLAWILAFLTRWFINALLLKLTASVTDELTIDGFGWAMGGALLMSGLGTLGQWLILGLL